MDEIQLLDLPTYDPGYLLDELRIELKAKSDAALARILSVSPPVISRIRAKKLVIGASLLIRMHEETEMSIRELRDLMGDTRRFFSLGTGGRRKGVALDQRRAA